MQLEGSRGPDLHPDGSEQPAWYTRPIMQFGKRLGRKCSLVQDKLVVNDKSFTVNNIDKVPFDISHLGTERTDTHILFGGRLSRFSNFFTRKNLLTLDDINFCSTEQ